jgi:hypothetical protein
MEKGKIFEGKKHIATELAQNSPENYSRVGRQGLLAKWPELLHQRKSQDLQFCQR